MARLLFTAREFGSLADPVNPAAIENLETLIGKPVQLMQQTHGNNLFEVKSFENIKQNTDSLIT